MKRIEKLKFNFHAGRFNRVVKRFTKTVAPGLKVELGTDFSYGDDKATYSFTMSDMAERLFMGSVSKAAKRKEVHDVIERINPDSFTVSLLHEIGHYYTEEEYDSAWEESERRMITLKFSASERKSDKVRFNLQYFELPSERAATEWAVDFMTSNRNYTKEWTGRFRKHLMRFYKGIGLV